MTKIFLNSFTNSSPRWQRQFFLVIFIIGIPGNMNRGNSMILEVIASICLIGGGLLLVYKLMNDKRFFSNDSSGGGQKVWRK